MPTVGGDGSADKMVGGSAEKPGCSKRRQSAKSESSVVRIVLETSPLE